MTDKTTTPTPSNEDIFDNYKGTRRIRLPGGQLVSIEEWITGDLYSAMIVDPRNISSRFRLFGYARGDAVVGSTSMDGREAKAATTAHTNVPRSANAGLPQDWEMLATHWRATTSARLDDEIAEWAAATSVEYVYNDKSYAAATLLDLLHARRPIGDPFPLLMRENVSWFVDVNSSSEDMERVRRSRAGVDPRIQGALAELQAIIMTDPNHPSSKLAASAYDRLVALRPFTVWVHIEGVLRRAVM